MIYLNDLLNYKDDPEFDKAMKHFYKENEKEFWNNSTYIEVLRMLSKE